MLFYFINCVLGFTMLFSFGHSQYLCSQENKAWDRAAELCYNVNGNILNADNIQELDPSDLIKANLTEFWTSNIIEVARAVEYLGCYVYSASVSQNILTPVRGGTNLIDCQSTCSSNSDNYPFYGLYGNTCICNHGSKANFKSSNQSCFQNCSIESLEFCQDSKLIAIYRRISHDSIKLQTANFETKKCVARVNSTTSSRVNCQKILQYQCNGTVQNGTFWKAIEECGEKLDRNQESNNSWRPVFFPTLDRIKSQLSSKENQLKMKICKSFKVDGNTTDIKERRCTDSLPYICKPENANANSKYLRPCTLRMKQTTTPSMTTQALSTISDIHASTVSNTGIDTHEATSDINVATTMSHEGGGVTERSSTTTETVTSQFSSSTEASTSQLSTTTETLTSQFSSSTEAVTSQFRTTKEAVSSQFSTTTEAVTSGVSIQSTDSKSTPITQQNTESITTSSSSDDHTANNVYTTTGESPISSTSVSVTMEQDKSSAGVTVTNDRNTDSTLVTRNKSVIQSSNDASEQSNKKTPTDLILGISCGAAAIILIVIIIFIVKKRRTYIKKKHKKDLDTVHLQNISGNQEKQDGLKNQTAAPYPLAISVDTTLGSNQGNDVYAVVNKTKKADNRKSNGYSLATPISSSHVQREKKEGTADIYAVVNKVEKETTKGEAENNTGNEISSNGSEFFTGNDEDKLMHAGCNDNKNVSAESEWQPENDVAYPFSAGSDYDHLNFRGSKHTDELPVESDGLYDHAAVGHNRADDIYDGVQRDVEQHGHNNTYDHVSAL